MAEESFQEKTEEATPKKRQKAREEGQVAKSMEINSVFVVLMGVSTLYLFARFMYHQTTGLFRNSLTFTTIPVFSLDYGVNLFYDYTLRFIIICSPIFLVVFITALAANIAQVGFVLSPKAMEPKLSNLSILKGFKRLFSSKALMEFIKSLFKLSVIGTIAVFAFKSEIPSLLKLQHNTTGFILVYICKESFNLFIWVLMAMMVIAIMDYAFIKWKFEKDLMMTKQEIKDEFKQTEGDPQVRSRIRSIQQQAARKRMMQKIPEADVVVTNPTHLAIAISYDALQMTAPQVVAKGADLVAQRIKKIANENNIPVVENKKLAQNLYKLVDIGEEVPSEFYMAVAEILAYVYKLKGKSVS